MYKFYLILSCLFSLSLCNWTNPILIETNGSTYSNGIYLNPNKDIFVFYSKGNSICYKIVKDIPKENCLPQSVSVMDLFVTGINDGNGVFIAFSANRSINGKNCNVNDTSGCNDVYYIESQDKGSTWSKALQVPRTNLSDAVHRNSPQVLYINETGKIFIFYNMPGEEIHKIYKVSRAKGANVFNTEKEIYKNRYSITHLKVQFIEGDDRIIFVGFEVLYWLTLMGSTDGGSSWKFFKPLQYVTKELSFVLSKTSNGETLFVVVMDMFGLFMYSIGIDLEIAYNGYFELAKWLGHRPLVCPYPEDQSRFIVSGVLQNKNQSTYVVNHMEEVMTDLDITAPISPFDQIAVIKTDVYKINVLHNITKDLYLSTLTIPVGGADGIDSSSDNYLFF